MKQLIDIFDYAGQICKAMPRGILLTTASGETVNTMTIGWGTLGIEWGKKLFVAYVRESRYTKELLDAAGEFTVNIPLAKIDKNIIALCGTKSGRDINKLEALGLTTQPGRTVSVPGISQLPLTLECKVIYRQTQDPDAIDKDCFVRFYGAGTHNAGDYHTVYFGEITDAYIIE